MAAAAATPRRDTRTANNNTQLIKVEGLRRPRRRRRHLSVFFSPIVSLRHPRCPKDADNSVQIEKVMAVCYDSLLFALPACSLSPLSLSLPFPFTTPTARTLTRLTASLRTDTRLCDISPFSGCCRDSSALLGQSRGHLVGLVPRRILGFATDSPRDDSAFPKMGTFRFENVLLLF